MFAWLGAAFVIDAVDGTLARRTRVEETVPHIDGVVLDLVVDFLHLCRRAARCSVALGPSRAAICGPCVLPGLHGFGALFRRQTDEDPDLWFRGFPAIWNVLVFYLLVLRPGPLCCSLIVIAARGPDVRAGGLRYTRCASCVCALSTMTATARGAPPPSRPWSRGFRRLIPSSRPRWSRWLCIFWPCPCSATFTSQLGGAPPKRFATRFALTCASLVPQT